jgi:hypothetical protein
LNVIIIIIVIITVAANRPSPRLSSLFRNKHLFYGEELLAPRTTLKLEDRPLSFVRGCLFYIFAPTLHCWRLSLHLQSEEAPCFGDKETPLNMEGKRSLGRPRRRWIDNIKMNLVQTGLGVVDWIGLAEDRYRWRALVNAVMNLRVP